MVLSSQAWVLQKQEEANQLPAGHRVELTGLEATLTPRWSPLSL